MLFHALVRHTCPISRFFIELSLSLIRVGGEVSGPLKTAAGNLSFAANDEKADHSPSLFGR